tara:strand:+ start:6349 stop:8124 length:1776 start_codon:yes stop_codon:yes gene_type:complete
MSISSSFLDRLLTTVNIVDVIGRRINLERRGGAYWAKCPFHGSGEERTASLKIYDETGTFHCFGCKESGNAIHFIRKYDGLDFIESVELLASLTGLEVPRQESFTETKDTSKINNQAAEIFYEQLKSDDGKKAVEYLKKRGISGETAKIFNLGYSKIKKPNLFSKLKQSFDETELEDSGLFGIGNDKEFYDRFRDRLMFPIRNVKGDCIAFGGRLLEEKKDQAKYLNSPETQTYKKKYELYGLYEVRNLEKRPKSIFLVEGYMDVIGLYQNDVKNAVASSGTAFTQEQLRKILNYTNTLYIVFDGDDAGLKASWRAAENALSVIREDTRINFIFLETGSDPDSFINDKGKDAFLDLAQNSINLSDYFFQNVKSQDDLSSIEGRASVAKFALPLVKKITNETIKEVYIKEMSNLCDIDFGKLIKGQVSAQRKAIIKKVDDKKNSNSILIKSVLNIFICLIQYPKLSNDAVFHSLPSDSRFYFVKNISHIFKENIDHAPSMIIEKIESDKIKSIFGEALVSEMKLSYEDAEKMLHDCINLIMKTEIKREEILKDKYNMQEISSAEKRELQQLILKKDKISEEDQNLIRNLSLK